MNKKVELLAPAGDLEKLKIAFAYGADAVYMGGKNLGLRQKAKNFDYEDMKEAIDYAHEHNGKVYVTANIFAHDEDFYETEEYFKTLYDIGVDALIISDPGIFSVAKSVIPKMELHISTQANITNYYSANFWREQGAKRVILARELSFDEIKNIHDKTTAIDPDFQIETFVHGAMCISYSGRCLLSNYMTGRDANRGECAQACRWRYHLMEQKRPGEYMPVFEDERGTYIFNSKDLCMIEYIPELLNAGVSSLKVEGRMKTVHYVATITKAYREAIDDYYKDINLYKSKLDYYIEEIKKASHRPFTTGFYQDKPDENSQIYGTNTYVREYDFVGLVEEYDEKTGIANIEQRNKFVVGDEIEILNPKKENFKQIIKEIVNDEGESVMEAPHPQQKLKIKLDQEVEEFSILRREG